VEDIVRYLAPDGERMLIDYTTSAGDVVVRPIEDLSEWNVLFGRVARPHFSQSAVYGEAKRATEHWSVRRLVFERSGEPLAICQVLDKRVFGLRIASRINRGPLFLDPDPTPDTVRLVFGALRRQWRYFLKGPLLIAPGLLKSAENEALLTALGYHNRNFGGWSSSLIDLELDEDELRRNLVSEWRNRLGHSERAGLVLKTSNSLETLEWLLARHVENMKVKNFAGPSPAFVRSLYEYAPERFTIVQAISGSEPVAAMGAVEFGETAEYLIGWFGEAGRKANAGNFLYWNIILEMKRRRCRWFDLGGYSRSDKYGRFKRGMRGEEYHLIGERLAI
jgi:hypothetical protein